MTKTRKILKKIVQLEHQATMQMVTDYPVGTNVEWVHGHHRRYGKVIGHNPYFPKLEIMTTTNTRVWRDVDTLEER